jgi:hypothetical protein
MPLCDGCGAQVDDAHIRHRIERLEFATRFRPIHIAVLLIDAGPPARPEEYFYRPAANRDERSSESAAYFEALMKAAGAGPNAYTQEETALAEFQRHGFFLVSAIECALANPASTQTAIERSASTLLRRVKVSYKPKSIALLSGPTQPLIAHFQQNGWSSALILNDGKPFEIPAQDEILAKALAKSSAPKAHA